jgi:hypothetical protein
MFTFTKPSGNSSGNNVVSLVNAVSLVSAFARTAFGDLRMRVAAEE